MRISGVAVPVRYANTVIVGAGAAGMNCAVQLLRFWRSKGLENPHKRLVVVTAGLALGASRMSGSDKQTYYKMGTSPGVPDTAEDFARTLTRYGCCHGDTALVEGLCSLRSFYNLVELGVPFPRGPCGAFVGYKTDNDPYERATSAGPRTSRYMSERLQAEAERLGVTIVDKHSLIEFVTDGAGRDRRIVAMLCFDLARTSEDGPGLSAFVADNWVLAAGGPGELYASTVYPRGQAGIHAPALAAGLVACNLTESQYGLASVKFRWNVSGTYMQAIPRIFSTAPDGGGQREFLTEYFTDTPTMATNIFLKGYQWPFDANHLPGLAGHLGPGQYHSSLIDLAVHQETVVRGRRVWMDFQENPIGAEGWEAFQIGGLGEEARQYLAKTGALQAAPIARLEHMNPPAIDIYAEHGIDIRRQPLEIALCAQHHNGGLAVDKWWQGSLPHTFVIGEMAGTHGVRRPGGAALNAGQVGGLRAAEFIANAYCHELPRPALAKAARKGLIDAVGRLKDMLAKGCDAEVTPQQAMLEVGRRMTRHAAHIRTSSGARTALAEAVEQYSTLLANGLRISSPAQLPAAVQTLQQCLAQIAMLKAICGMFQRGAGSRGSYCVLADDGVEVHPALIDPDTGRPYRVRPENESLRDQILCLRYDPEAEDLFELWDVRPREIPRREIAFEPAWAEFRQGRIYEL